jgi:HSP20 family molecular chaperone IbpA
MSKDITKHADGSGRATPHLRGAARPNVDVYESDAELLLVADLPGVTKEALDIRFDRGELTIEARRPKPENEARPAAEAARRDFFRAFAIPDTIDTEKVEAELANGVLRVHLPKTAAKRSRRIDVRAG